MLKFIKSLFPYALRQQWKRSLFSHQDMASRLANLRRAGFQPQGIIDGGAYRGDWVKDVWAVWPGVPCALVEPQLERKPQLERLARQVNGSFVVAQALGSQSGTANFQLCETASGISDEVIPGKTIEVPITTIKAILNEHPGFKSDFLKLDLQGYELPALKGAGVKMQQFEVVLLEVSIIRIGDVPSFSEMDQFMISQGFRVYDVIPQYYRPLDGALWQMDVFFVRNDSSLVVSRQWQ
jgi:FkbM family methyltransferase